ncbi:MAG: DUF3786 domain-containing protein [Lachnospiraceae bacterium]|nr:DUF3786 domain-containing protein [Lachnospiraceae bacterium]
MEYAKDSKERVPFEHYLALFRQANPVDISNRTNVPYDRERQCFTIRFMNTPYKVTWPDYQITHLEETVGYYPLEDMVAAKILILRYLLEGCYAPASGKLFTYREMPWGEVYFRQFQGRCIMRLAFGFGNKLQKFQEVMEKLGAVRLTDGDCSYELELLEGLFLRFILWEGDEEFPPSSQILFSDNFPLAFAGEDMAVVGDITIGTFKKL